MTSGATVNRRKPSPDRGPLLMHPFEPDEIQASTAFPPLPSTPTGGPGPILASDDPQTREEQWLDDGDSAAGYFPAGVKFSRSLENVQVALSRAGCCKDPSDSADPTVVETWVWVNSNRAWPVVVKIPELPSREYRICIRSAVLARALRLPVDPSGWAETDAFELLANLLHDGDMADTVSSLLLVGTALATAPLVPVERSRHSLASSNRPDRATENSLDRSRIRWGSFWREDHVTEDWAIPNFVARARSHALYASAKTGKSLLVLEACATAVTGRSVFGQEPVDPIGVLYIDLEMTEADLYERLVALGYGPADDLDGFVYLSLPVVGNLGSEADGGRLIEYAVHLDVDVVVIDTVSRVVEGEENQADTYRSLHRHTLHGLKRHGIAVLRIDHSGKDASKGQRGSSAKNDDVDVVYRLSRKKPAGYIIEATHQRMGWVNSRMTLLPTDAPEILAHQLVAPDCEHPPGTEDAAALLDDLGVPLHASVREAENALRSADKGKRTGTVAAAMKWRRETDGRCDRE